LNGNKHRLNGPAVLRKNGNSEWYVFGEKITNCKTKSQNLTNHSKRNSLTDIKSKSEIPATKKSYKIFTNTMNEELATQKKYRSNPNINSEL